jgi:hypothetical protein
MAAFACALDLKLDTVNQISASGGGGRCRNSSIVRTKMNPKMQSAHVRTAAYGPTFGGNGIPSTLNQRLATATIERTYIKTTHAGNRPGSIVRRRWNWIRRTKLKMEAAAALDSGQMTVSGT